ncbi:AraC-type DNA-binding protein [Filimonas lacunae]|uniref:AraC-type DNA-binding protein n=1 Tax=Filimonas lacunae TaxID=477680 RepID=A0A173MII2_9BACT|nr:AraC family transcriptional regulator [Filimonas lacunae]BAV07231.1 transcriptional regulator, AraC family [Filimonas lacunae]SIS92874.1 AraC-type DNA-binding protein [Filimonas lacunae]
METGDNTIKLQHPQIIANNYGNNFREGEAFVTDHIFSYILSGTQEIWSGNQTYLFKAGDYRFFKRNQLTKYVKRPGQQGFQSIAVHIDENTLREMTPLYADTVNTPYTGKDVELLKPDSWLESYANSIAPYCNASGVYNQALVSLKTKELVLLLLQNNPALKQALFNFDDPGKIDLVAFMSTHYRYNVGLDRMAFLTGRSLSTFKRDFQKLFHTTAGRWLTQRRLEEANYLIAQKGRMASEIYLDLGFEDLSHFSFAYKKAFGKAPSQGQ